MRFSVIITCYNQASTLQFLLNSLSRQTIDLSRFEVLIADDGSTDDSSKVSQVARTFPVRFITQDDQGYRKSKILNEAIRQAKYEYLVFLDADVILERHFLQDHLALSREGHFVCGRRVDLGPSISQKIKSEDVIQGRFDGLSWEVLMSGVKKDSAFVKRGIRVPYFWLRKILRYDRPLDLLGSNLSLWKSDILEVNGFNEAFESYWGEDGDLFIRLKNVGKKIVGAKGLCIQFHIYHPRRTPTSKNLEHYQQLLLDSSYKWAVNGMNPSK